MIIYLFILQKIDVFYLIFLKTEYNTLASKEFYSMLKVLTYKRFVSSQDSRVSQ